jgi:uncharacterized membrane protein
MHMKLVWVLIYIFSELTRSMETSKFLLMLDCYGIACLRLSKLLLWLVSLRKNWKLISWSKISSTIGTCNCCLCIGFCVTVMLYSAVLCISNAVYCVIDLHFDNPHVCSAPCMFVLFFLIVNYCVLVISLL